VYTPDLNYNGSDSFTYRVFDTVSLQSDTGTVTITINPVNDAPVAMDDEYETQEEEPLVVDVPGILANDEDVDDSTFTIVLIGSVSNGVLELDDDGSFTYTPDEGYSGTDQFYYRINDGELSSDIAVVTIMVSPVDDPPIAEDISVTLSEDGSASITLIGTDEDTDDNDLSITIVDSASHGDLSSTRILDTYTYTPNANYFGADTFTYRVFDTVGDQSDTATVSITITSVNDAPQLSVTGGPSFITPEEIPLNITVSVSDIDAGSPSLIIAVNPFYGNVTSIDNGSGNYTLTYTPINGFSGGDNFVLVATETTGDIPLSSNYENIIISVTPVNDPPNVYDMTWYGEEDQVSNIDLIGDDPDGDSFTYLIASQPAHGTATIEGNVVTYTPVANYNGSDSFTYQANDGNDENN
ncbi:uncharacterized protein METZ01_LOCUS281909, partial [marine metagenome]